MESRAPGIVDQSPRSRVLILTTFDLDEYAFSALPYGASGSLLKDVPPAELVGAFRAVASGDAARIVNRAVDTRDRNSRRDHGRSRHQQPVGYNLEVPAISHRY